ncbi:hypothetical protein LEP1GSC193_2262 [Leptospira alstonii serovar Pingchang str. 80-412]|uniref:Uncharacterized protein n=2 Tax=Leptospira alstonii TaxID=28452 RepID=M6CVU7_9LEPT|nr:hypothetical protein LEP1GSC194_0333 [Leptospira alstonii serovar Sichuan str. 79601]EQA79895.1 hypothetical protein LEP1GSC193_2262 [Leptospira alstonii serovar Pingchang str. 80-412]
MQRSLSQPFRFEKKSDRKMGKFQGLSRELIYHKSQRRQFEL